MAQADENDEASGTSLRTVRERKKSGSTRVWPPTHTQSLKIAINIVDWGTHFQLVVPLTNRTTQATRERWRQWIRFF
jgi:hypothetical protein